MTSKLKLTPDGPDIEFVIGDDFEVPFVFTDAETGDPFDLSAYTVSARVMRGTTEVDAFSTAVSGAGDNVLTLSLTDTETAAIGGGGSELTYTVGLTLAGFTRQYVTGRFHGYGQGEARPGSPTTGVTIRVGSVAVQVSAVGGAAVDAAALAADPAFTGTYGLRLPTANDTDDTDALNAALQAAAGQTIVAPAGNDYKITAPLVIESGTTLDLTDCTITLLSGSECNMIVNAANAADTGSDTNITIRGGVWDRLDNSATAELDRHSIYLRRVTGLLIENVTYRSTDGKFGMCIYNCHDFVIRETTLDCDSDGIHLQGACSNGLVSGVYGEHGDDAVAILPVDYPNYTLPADDGNVKNIVIERVYTTAKDTSAGFVKISTGNDGTSSVAGSPYTVENVTVRHVRANSPSGGSPAVWCGGDPTYANTQDGIMKNIVIDDVTQSGQAHTVMLIEALIRDVKLSRIGCPADASHYAVYVSQGVDADCVTVDNCNFEPVAGSYAIYLASLTPQPKIQCLRVTNCRHNPATKSGGLISTNHGSQQLANVMLENHYVTQTAWAVGSFNCTVNVYMTNVRAVNVNGWVYAVANATVIKGAVGLWGNVYSVAGSAVRSEAAEFQVDVGLLAITAGQRAWNTNAARACGVGPVVADATTWTNLHTGATYTP